MKRSLVVQGLAILLVCVAALPASAQNTGTLTGIVIDSLTGAPVAGAEVVIGSLGLSATTDSVGRYTINGITPGTYTVNAQLYLAKSRTLYRWASVRDVTINPRQVSITNVTMGNIRVHVNPAVDFGKLHLQLQPGGALRNLWQIISFPLPVRGYTEFAGLMPGALQLPGGTNTHSGEVSVRGGGPEETIYLVDGFSQQDPFTGSSIAYMNDNFIDWVGIRSGAFDAAYDNGLSGAVDVHSRLPDRFIYQGTVETVTDNFHGAAYDYNIYSAVLTGPLMRKYDRLRFAAGLERDWLGDASPRSISGDVLPHHSSGVWNWQGKLRWCPDHQLTVTAGTLGSDLDAKLFSMPFYFDRDHAPRATQENRSVWVSAEQQLSPRTSYTISGNWFSTESKIGDGAYFDDIWAYGRPDGNIRFDETILFQSGDNPNTPSPRDHVVHIDPAYGYGYITVDDTLPGGTPITQDVVVQDERGFVRHGRWREQVDSALAQGGNPWYAPELIVRDNEGNLRFADESFVHEDFEKRKTSYTGLRADLTYHIAHHKLTAGAEFQHHTLRYYRHLFPSWVFQDSVANGVWYDNGGFKDVDHYGYDVFGNESDTLSEGTKARHPYNFSVYFQDKFTLEDLSFNVGLRLDTYDPNMKHLRWLDTPLGAPDDGIADDLDNVLDPTDLEDALPKTSLSPRLGIALQPGDGTVIHFSYGRFIQRPALQELYSGWDFMGYRLTSAGYDYALGSPDLKPTRSTSYEIGVNQKLRDRLFLEVTGFYREVTNLRGMQHRAVAGGAAGRDYGIYANGGTYNVQGLEVQLSFLRLSLDHWFSGQLNYTLLDADGTLTPPRQRNIAWTVSEVPSIIGPWYLDRRHTVTVIVDGRVGDGRGLRIGGIHPFERAGFNAVFRMGTGFPYSPMVVYNEVTLGSVSPVPAGRLNSSRTALTYRIDLKLHRQFQLGWTACNIYLEVINLLDRENVIEVYQGSGQPNRTGWLQTQHGQRFIQSNLEPDWTGLNGEQKYRLREADPFHYDTPRQIRLGMRVDF